PAPDARCARTSARVSLATPGTAHPTPPRRQIHTCAWHYTAEASCSAVRILINSEYNLATHSGYKHPATASHFARRTDHENVKTRSCSVDVAFRRRRDRSNRHDPIG